MFDELNELYQQVILDHCKHPRNFRELSPATCSAQGHNPLCGDQLNLFLTLEGETVKDASFLGSGCCISKASATLLTETAKGKTRAELQHIFDRHRARGHRHQGHGGPESHRLIHSTAPKGNAQ